MAGFGKFQWVEDSVLANNGHPRIVAEALAEFGTHEGVGATDNPKILAWAKEVGLETAYRHDSTAWCGLFMALCVYRAGYKAPVDPLWALNWATFGEPMPINGPRFGDVLVFERRDSHNNLIGGHVGLYVAETTDLYYVLGGNEADAVSIVPISKARIRAVREPHYTVTPANVRKIVISPSGQPISTNEA